MNPLISMIIPVFNAEPYLETCLDSILAQTWRNLEILIINDGSTDESPEICDAYAEKDERISVIHQEHRGAASARNTGLRKIKGDFLCFVDADDLIAPEYVECLYQAAAESGAGISRCNYRVFEGNQIPFPAEGSVPAANVSFRVYPGREIVKRMIGESRETAIWRGLYRRSVLEGLFFEEGRLFEDVLFSCRANLGTSVAVLEGKALYAYRYHPAGISRQREAVRTLDSLTVREQRIACLKESAPDLAELAELELAAEILQILAGLDRSEEDAELRSDLLKRQQQYPYKMGSVWKSELRPGTKLLLTGAKLSAGGCETALRIMKKLKQ